LSLQSDVNSRNWDLILLSNT